MFSILEKKIPLKVLFPGAVDIHSHLLPGIDDGAAHIEDSVSMIKRLRELGIIKFIATPHIMNDYYPNTTETIAHALHLLKEKLKEEGLADIKIKAAAEYMMDHSFMEIMEKQNLLTLKGKFVLVEMSYFQAPINLYEILFQLQTRGYKPVLAHPERYIFFHSKSLEKYEDLKNRGCLFQLNVLSVTGHYGKSIEEMVFKLMDNGMIDFIGSDTHQHRHLNKLTEAKLPKKKIDQLRPIFERTAETFLFTE